MENLGVPAQITEIGPNTFDIRNIFGEPLKAGIVVHNADAAKQLHELSETKEIFLVRLDDDGNLHFTSSGMTVIRQ
jgi:hypothetical protein